MKPISIKTEFSFSIQREFINQITDSFEGGLFEDIDISYGKKNHNVLGRCNVKYTLITSIQSKSLESVNFNLINRTQQQHKAKLLKRIADVKDKIKVIKIRSLVSLIDTIHV